VRVGEVKSEYVSESRAMEGEIWGVRGGSPAKFFLTRTVRIHRKILKFFESDTGRDCGPWLELRSNNPYA